VASDGAIFRVIVEINKNYREERIKSCHESDIKIKTNGGL
jgi:hypothetical protein